MRPELSHQEPPQPDRPSERQDVYELSLRVQRQIMEKLPDDATRLEWIDEHAATFRRLVDTDEGFRTALSGENIDAIIKRVEDEDNRIH